MVNERRLIYAEDLLDSLKNKVCIINGNRNGKTLALFESVFRKLIEITPTVDAVEVVRCKNCEKRTICRTSTVWAVAPDDDWYCADGKRRSNT